MSPTETSNDHAEEHISPAGLKMLFAFLFVFVAAWGGAIYLFGVPGLYLPALALVPVVYLFLIVAAKG